MHDQFFRYIEQLGQFQSILTLDGDLPDTAFFTSLSLPLFAVDGAANTLVAKKVPPELILGDLDSVSPDIRKAHTVLKLADQNFSDFEKALQYLESIKKMPTIVLGVNGGFIDHVLNNVSISCKKECVFYCPPIVGHVLKGTRELVLPVGSKLSLLGTPSARVSSIGLKWELAEFQLEFPGRTSCFNRTEQSVIKLHVHEGAALLFVYLQPISDEGSR